MAAKVNSELRELRAKAQLYDELVEQLTVAEQDLDRARRSATRDGVDPAWREIANALAAALRPYSLLSPTPTAESRLCPAIPVEDGVVDGSSGGGSCSRSARAAVAARVQRGPRGTGTPSCLQIARASP